MRSRAGNSRHRLAIGAMGLLVGLLGAAPLAAQTVPGDVPQDHWAYQAVHDLADKGLVKGYPNGKFLGNRALTRYEFATVIQRLLQTVDDMIKAATPSAPPPPAPAAPPPPPPPPQVTTEDLNKIQVLVDSFRTELTNMQTDLKKATDDIDALREDVLQAKQMASKAQATADNSYGSSSSRKFAITGYVQARYQMADSGSQTRYPQGAPASTGAGQVNGNYAQGGNRETFVVRRARLKFTGNPFGNARYGIQIDTGGATSLTNQQVTVREGYVAYTFGNGDIARYPTVTAGLYANPFGYQLPLSSSLILAPERPLAFNEGGSGLFTNQDYDKGAQLNYPFGPFKLSLNAVNGTGLSSNDVDKRIDEIYRFSWQHKSKVYGAGVSYYDGQLPGTGVGLGNPTATPPVAAYRGGQKQLIGADAQFISPSGPFLIGEYINGKYEKRSYFDNTVSGGTSLVTTTLAPGNRIEGYYVQGGYTFGPKKKHPLTLGASYDVFRRSKSGVPATAAGGASGSSFDDENYGGGILYALDPAARLRLWYEKPNKVAHAAGQPEPAKIGLFTAELQLRF